MKAIVRALLKGLYRVELHGLEHYDQASGRVLIVANHQSFLDPVLLWAFLPGDLSFAINSHIARLPWVRPFLRFARVFSLDPRQAGSLKSLIRHLQEGHRTVIFPEGRITVTGTLMKIYDGPGMVADRAGAMVLPVRIDGAQFTPFSRLKSRYRWRWFPRIHVHILPARDICPPSRVKGAERRKQAGLKLADLMAEMILLTSPCDRTLFSAILDAKHFHGGARKILEDGERRPLSYRALIARSVVLSKLLRRHTGEAETVGLLLPSANTTVALLFGCQLAGRLPAMLNYTAGSIGLSGACSTGQIRHVITSHRFIELAQLQEQVETLHRSGIQLHYLEDWKRDVGVRKRLWGLVSGLFARLWYRPGEGAANEPAVMLFTSGSEGKPKAVLLSHRNILTNCAQLGATVDFNAQDVVLNVLPMFHVFGLGPGLMLPLISGMSTFLYPNPLHYKLIPELCYEINATVLFGTNTFLGGYGRCAHPYDFYSLRYVFAGAEKLQEEVRQLWMDKFGIRILEGYGATESSPVLAVNTPMFCRAGTVGRFLPGIRWRLEAVEGLTAGGRLHVQGDNIMLGYYLPQCPGELKPPQTRFGTGWYDTGDVVQVDDDGFVTIVGRLKRFAKVGGEMVPLTAIESLASRVWPDHHHAVIAMADTRKGEEILLVSECEGASLDALKQIARKQGLPELWLPRRMLFVPELPLLGSGKVDYSRIQDMVQKHHALSG